MDSLDRRSLNTRYTLVDGELYNQLLHFVYDHEEEELLVQPRGRLLFETHQNPETRAIDALKMVVTPALHLKASLIQKAESTKDVDPEEAAHVVEEWFKHLIQQAQDARSQFLN